jgi:hypothetical protein
MKPDWVLEAERGYPGDRNIAWIPTHPRNPTKLEAHKLIDGKWKPTGTVRFVKEWVDE